TETSFVARSGALSTAYWFARPGAFPGLSGSACAPARAAASAVDWSCRFARYHEPTSSTSAVIPRRETTKTTIRTRAWPLSVVRLGCMVSLSAVSVHELNGVCAEVRAAPGWGRRGEAVPDDLGEPAGERAVVALRVDRLDVEAHPADHVVLRVRALAGQRVVDREEHLRADAEVERVLDLIRVELDPRVGEVAPDREVVLEALLDPVGEGRR